MAISAAVAAAAIGGATTIYAANKSSKASAAATAAAKESSDRQMALAEAQYDRYLELYAPVEEEAIQEARNFGSIANQEDAAGRAAADVMAAQGGAKDQLSNQLSSMGVNPNDQKFANTMASMDLNAAAQSAASQTGARDKVRNVGFSRLQDVASLGKGIPSSTAAMMSTAGNGQVAAANASASRWGSTAAGLGGLTGSVLNSQAFQNWWNTPSVTDGGYGIGNGSAYSGSVSDAGVFTPFRAGM